VLDARQRGNTLRFANHSAEPNAEARITMVDGDHRVAIYAKEDIAPGEEIFYNYRRVPQAARSACRAAANMARRRVARRSWGGGRLGTPSLLQRLICLALPSLAQV
jgi:SET domain-containing protein